MLEFVLAPENTPFTIALTMMAMLSILEILGAIIGTGFSSLLDRLIPHADLDYDLDSPDLNTYGLLGKVLSFVSFGRMPFLVLLILFLLSFGFTGLFIQECAQSVFGFLFSACTASSLAILVTLLLMRGIMKTLSKMIPQDETSAISQGSLIGRTAEVILGKASKGSPTQAKTTDRFGNVHYFMLEPVEPEEIFDQGMRVLLVKHDGVRFFAIPLKAQESPPIT